MKTVRTFLFVLMVLAVVVFKPMPVFAMEELEATDVAVLNLSNGEPGIMPLWSYTSSVTLNLTFSGSTAVCELRVVGASTASSIKANLWLYQKNNDGSWTVLKSWKNIETNSSSLLVSRYYNPVYYGQTYKLYFTGKCYAANGLYYDPLAAETIVTR